MSKHTPGPWALESVDTSVGSCHKIGPFPSAGVRSEVHACVYADRLRLGLDDENPIAIELIANARLIAAAPELLAAIQRILSEKRPAYHDCTDAGESQCAWCDAEAAIAKATGEA